MKPASLNMRINLILAIIIFNVFAATACAPKSPDASDSKTAAADKKSAGEFDHLSAEDRVAMSDAETDEAEDGLTFENFSDAVIGFNKALRLNPDNHRAQFWAEILKPLAAAQGFAARVRPFYLKAGGPGIDRYTTLVRRIQGMNSNSMQKFLLTGPPDITNQTELREWIDRMIVTLDGLRTFIRSNKDREYVLRVSPQFIVGKLVREINRGALAEECQSQFGDFGENFGACDNKKMITLRLNRADLEVIQGHIAASMLYLALLHAYDIEPHGVFDIQDEDGPGHAFLRILGNHKGGLFQRHHLDIASSVGTDIVAAQRYLLSEQAELCSREGRIARRDSLYASGLCYGPRGDAKNQVHRSMNLIETVLAGKPIPVDIRTAIKPLSVDLMKFFREPPQNIAVMKPTQFSTQVPNRVVGVDDAAYAPFFVSGNMNELIRAHNQCVDEDAFAEAKARANYRQSFIVEEVLAPVENPAGAKPDLQSKEAPSEDVP